MAIATSDPRLAVKEIDRIGDNPAIGGLDRLEGHGALAQIIQGEAGQDQPQPGRLDWPPAKMAHVGIERLSAGDRQEHRPEGEQAGLAIGDEKHDTVGRAYRRQRCSSG